MRRVLLLAALAACDPPMTAPPGQILLYVDTDAPLPPGAGRSVAADFGSGVAPQPLFDRLQVDVYKPNEADACLGCSRAFSIDAEQMSLGHVSIGIPCLPSRLGYRVRLRLYSGRSSLSGQPPDTTPDGRPAQSVIDVTAALPPIPQTGIVDRWVFLPTDSVGTPIGADTPIETNAGKPPPSKVGTWPGAKRIPCEGEPALGEVCVPGGAFWMGNPHSVSTGVGDRAERSRLVVLSPFYMQQTEVTVAQYRIFGRQNVLLWSGSNAGDFPKDYCTFTVDPGDNERKPVNCILWDDARRYCKAGGLDLPTEAQYEYAAGGLASHLYVWGEEEPRCSDAIFGRAGFGLFSTLAAPCKSVTDPPGGPLDVGFHAIPARRDRLWTGTGTIYDLIGNIAEYAVDEFQQEDANCWGGGGVFRDPLCQNGTGVHTVRGGEWRAVGNLMIAAARFGVNATFTEITTGFRCARPGL